MNKDKLYKNLPEKPGVYIMEGVKGKVLYVGKAGNLKKRVSSYFLRPHDARIERLISEIKKIDYKTTGSVLEALILESELIKKYLPSFNVKDKDDKSFLWIKITDNEDFPRLLLVRGKEKGEEKGSPSTSLGVSWFGPFVSAGELREAVKIIRRIFSFSTHTPEKINKFDRPCLDYEIGLCPGTCVGAISKSDYKKIVRNIKLFLQGRKKTLLKDLEQKMEENSEKMEFERAGKIRRQIFALEHIQDTVLITSLPIGKENKKRIEGYDISNISGTSAVGGMAVFRGDEPDKSQYRKFKIKSIKGQNDTGMIKEILYRRFKHTEWPLPNLILIDGGKPQINAAKKVIEDFGLNLPVAGIAKGLKRKKNEFFGMMPRWADKKILMKVRDEAHRFAVKYHKKLRKNV